MDSRDDRFQVATIDPVLVGQIWRSHVRFSFGVLAMAGGAGRSGTPVGPVYGGDAIGRGIRGVAEQMHVDGYASDLHGIQHLIAPEGRHREPGFSDDGNYADRMSRRFSPGHRPIHRGPVRLG